MYEDKTDLELFLEEEKIKAKRRFIFWMIFGSIMTILVIFCMFLIFNIIGTNIAGAFYK